MCDTTYELVALVPVGVLPFSCPSREVRQKASWQTWPYSSVFAPRGRWYDGGQEIYYPFTQTNLSWYCDDEVFPGRRGASAYASTPIDIPLRERLSGLRWPRYTWDAGMAFEVAIFRVLALICEFTHAEMPHINLPSPPGIVELHSG